MEREAALREIQQLVNLSKTSSQLESIRCLREAATLCMEKSSQARNDYIKSSFRNRAAIIINKAERIKSLMERQSASPNSGLGNMSSVQEAVEEMNSTLTSILREPSNSRTLPNKEYLIMLRAGKIYGRTFKPWTKAPGDDDFVQWLAFSDDTPFFMPASLSEHLEAWKRPHLALPPPQIRGDAQGSPKQEPSMKPDKPINLVQDASLNCSLVAALCAIVGRIQRGFTSILNGVMYPYDIVHDHPALSGNGRYMFRFYFNGHYRLVEVDDKLPVSKSDRVLHVTDRNNPSLLWPALLEKAYFKLMAGGYDWEGSNSATDLWVLTGWIPEHVVLQDPYPHEEEVWSRIFEPFHNGDVLITVGSPAMSRELEEYHGIIGNHNYVVLDLQEENNEPVLLIKNPWCESPESLNPNHELSNSFGKSGSAIPQGAKVEPGNFWMPLSKVFRLFHMLYLNWNPSVFQSRKDIHFNWDLLQPRSRTLATSPQFSISSDKGGTVYFILGRHLQDPVLIPKDEGSQEPGNVGKASEEQVDVHKSSSTPTKPPRAALNGFLSMYMLDRKGIRSYLVSDCLDNSPSLDGLQVYLSFKLEPKRSYTLAIKENLMPSVSQNFTLSVFSHFPIVLDHAKLKYAFSTSIQSQWTSAKYGLTSTSGAFNPQFRIIVPSPTPIAAFLDCEDEFAKINIKLCKRGTRILDPKRIDILTESHPNEYELGGTWLETAGWEIGSRDGKRSHTLLVLNMDDDYQGKFVLRLETNVPIKVEEIPNEYNGHLLRLPKAIFSGPAMRLAAPILPSPEGDLVKVLVRFDSNFIPGLPSDSRNGNAGCQSLIKVTVESGTGPNGTVIASTSSLDEEFRSVGKDGLRLAGIKLWRDMTIEPWDLFLVVERSGGSTLAGSEERFTVDVLTERLGSVKAESWRGWDD